MHAPSAWKEPDACTWLSVSIATQGTVLTSISSFQCANVSSSWRRADSSIDATTTKIDFKRRRSQRTIGPLFHSYASTALLLWFSGIFSLKKKERKRKKKKVPFIRSSAHTMFDKVSWCDENWGRTGLHWQTQSIKKSWLSRQCGFSHKYIDMFPFYICLQMYIYIFYTILSHIKSSPD